MINFNHNMFHLDSNKINYNQNYQSIFILLQNNLIEISEIFFLLSLDFDHASTG